jgi:hypothetical protein
MNAVRNQSVGANLASATARAAASTRRSWNATRKLLFAAPAALTLATSAVADDDDFHSHLPYLQDSGYLSEQLLKSAYRQTLDTLLRDNDVHVPPWAAEPSSSLPQACL